MDSTLRAFVVVVVAALGSSFLGACFGYLLVRLDPGIVFFCVATPPDKAQAAGIAVGAICGLLLGAAVMLVLQAARIVADALQRGGSNDKPALPG